MPCAGDIYFDMEAKKRLCLWGRPKLHFTVQWMGHQRWPGPIGIVCRGLRISEGWTQPIPESELPYICINQHIPQRIHDREYMKVRQFLPPSTEEQVEQPYQRSAVLSVSSLRPYGSAPLDAVEITVVEFGYKFSGISRISRDTIPVLASHNWRLTYIETDPCYEPPKRYFMERYRGKVYVD